MFVLLQRHGHAMPRGYFRCLLRSLTTDAAPLFFFDGLITHARRYARLAPLLFYFFIT